MDFNAQVELSSNGSPQALIPNQYMWELVEYLAFQRVHVLYSYDAERFVVSFPSMDREAAQRLLDEWVSSTARSNEHDQMTEHMTDFAAAH